MEWAIGGRGEIGAGCTGYCWPSSGVLSLMNGMVIMPAGVMKV